MRGLGGPPLVEQRDTVTDEILLSNVFHLIYLENGKHFNHRMKDAFKHFRRHNLKRITLALDKSNNKIIKFQNSGMILLGFRLYPIFLSLRIFFSSVRSSVSRTSSKKTTASVQCFIDFALGLYRNDIHMPYKLLLLSLSRPADIQDIHARARQRLNGGMRDTGGM